MSNRRDKFVIKAKEKFGDKFSYGHDYTKSDVKFTITCPIHGDFQQSPAMHLQSKHGCRLCAACAGRSTRDEFISKASTVHDNKFTYDKVNYVNSTTKVTITCPIHGDFEQSPPDHLSGYGCNQCALDQSADRYRMQLEDFVSRASLIHNNKFNYNKVEYVNNNTNVTITCPIHGNFEQSPASHLRGSDCPECAYQSRSHARWGNHVEEWKSRSNAAHDGKFDYSGVVWSGYNSTVDIICPIHGKFQQNADSHQQGSVGCRRCGQARTSSFETLVIDHLTELGIDVVLGSRRLIPPYEIDVFIPDLNIGFEINGVYWHSDAHPRIHRNYHRDKTQLAAERGIRLIHLWEDDLRDNLSNELRFITHVVGKSVKKRYARNTNLREIDITLARDFVNDHHVQGFASGSVYIGHFIGDELIGCTIFKKRKHDWELTRHCCSCLVVGSLGKAVKHFTSRFDAPRVVSFCDLTRYTGASYIAAGFKLESTIPPDYKYVVSGKRVHKFNFRRKSLKVRFPDVYEDHLSETEIMKKLNFHKIFDCGKHRFVYEV